MVLKLPAASPAPRSASAAAAADGRRQRRRYRAQGRFVRFVACFVHGATWRRYRCDAVSASSPILPPRPARFSRASPSSRVSFPSAKDKARPFAALRPQLVERAPCMPTALQQRLAAVFIPSACPSQAPPPPPPPPPSNTSASRTFSLTRRAPPLPCAFPRSFCHLPREFCTEQEAFYFIQGNSRRALHVRSHTTATGRACSGDRATSSWAAAAATQSVTLEHHARTAATHWHPRPPTPLGSPCPAAAACPSQDRAETEAAWQKSGARVQRC